MRTGELLGIAAVMAIILGVLMAALGPGSRLSTGWQYLTRGPSSPASGSSIVGSPSLTAQRIDSMLGEAGSPAAGTGATFYADSQHYGIDDAYALAWFKHESSFGTAGAATQTRNMGNIVCTAGYSCLGRFRAYPSWQAGIDDWYALIKETYIGQWGCSTVESIIPHYAPSSDSNNEAGYIASVERDVNAWRQS